MTVRAGGCLSHTITGHTQLLPGPDADAFLCFSCARRMVQGTEFEYFLTESNDVMDRARTHVIQCACTYEQAERKERRRESHFDAGAVKGKGCEDVLQPPTRKAYFALSDTISISQPKASGFGAPSTGQCQRTASIRTFCRWGLRSGVIRSCCGKRTLPCRVAAKGCALLRSSEHTPVIIVALRLPYSTCAAPLSTISPFNLLEPCEARPAFYWCAGPPGARLNQFKIADISQRLLALHGASV